MSAEKKQTEPNFRLIHPYTFDECVFDFTDPRTERIFALFGAVEITQNQAETVGLDGAFSSVTAYHTTLAENVALVTDSVPAEVPPHIVTVQVGAKDSVLVAEKEPIRVEFVEQVGLGTVLLHAQHGHIYINFTEKIGVSSVILPPIQTEIVEQIGIRDERIPQPQSYFSEALGFDGTQQEGQELSFILRDGGGLLDSQGQVFTAHRSFAEEISMQEETHGFLHLYRSFVERISLRTEILPPLSTLLVEGICLQGDRIPQPRSLISEKLVVSEALVPPLMSHFTEHIGVYDTVVRASDASISGVAVGNGMTLAEFKSRLMRPLGYETFRPFHVGEYEYEQALVRISMTTGSLGAIPQIYDVVMNVDIDDTVDRGTARVEAKETEIPYHKHYYTKPEVTVTLQRGNTGDGVLTPEITMIGTDFFRCILHKRDGTAATGTVSWTAVGY